MYIIFYFLFFIFVHYFFNVFGQWHLTGPNYKHWELRAKTLVAFGTCLEPSLPDTSLVAFTKRAHFRSRDSITRP